MAAAPSPAQPGSLAAPLPADLLHRIFCAAAPGSPYERHNVGVLSFEERARAEAVCKHWRSALSSRPAVCQSLALGNKPASFWSFGAAAAAESAAASGRALRLAEAVAARAPEVQRIVLQVHAEDGQQLSEAVKQALGAIMAHPGSRTLQVLLHDAGLERRLAAYLAAAVAPPRASLARLEVRLSFMRGDLQLMPAQLGPALPSLPHVKQLLVQSTVGCSVLLRLPMPQLEQLRVEALDEELGPVPARLVTVAPPQRPPQGAASAPPFPSLARADIDTVRLSLDGAAAPNLAALELQLFFPKASIMLRNAAALSSLSRLDLKPTTVFNDALLGELGPGEADTAIHSNCCAPLLASVARTLRQLSLSLEEPPNAAMIAALRGLAQLTQLSLRLGGTSAAGHWDGEEGEQEEAPQGPEPPSVHLDCQLLAGMSQLHQLALSQDRDSLAAALDSPAAMRRLSALHTLSLGDPSPLPALAPHLPPSLTRLDLPHTKVAQLGGDAKAALQSIPQLRCLSFEGREYASGCGKARLEEARSRHTAAVRAVRACLPPGCQLLAQEPAAGYWYR
ncbi:hypothetical protein ABPG75_010101 [Micractinium tetrahymenae]